MTNHAEQLAQALQRIVDAGAKFDAKGYHSDWVVKVASEALAAYRASQAKPPAAPVGGLMFQRVVNVRCNACDRSLVGVQCCDRQCDDNGEACGLRPLLAAAPAAQSQWLPPEKKDEV